MSSNPIELLSSSLDDLSVSPEQKVKKLSDSIGELKISHCKKRKRTDGDEENNCDSNKIRKTCETEQSILDKEKLELQKLIEMHELFDYSFPLSLDYVFFE